MKEYKHTRITYLNRRADLGPGFAGLLSSLSYISKFQIMLKSRCITFASLVRDHIVAGQVI